MARQAIYPLIDRLRVMVHDSADAPVFTDEELEGFLDANRRDVIAYPLTAFWQRVDGVDVCRVYTAPQSYWDDDHTLADANGTTVTPSASEPMVGRWTFDSGQTPPLYLTGSWYDLNGTAADVLEAWAAAEALNFDFEADGASYKRSQKAVALGNLARRYRSKSLPRTVQVSV